jgi:hypothetical protein
LSRPRRSNAVSYSGPSGQLEPCNDRHNSAAKEKLRQVPLKRASPLGWPTLERLDGLGTIYGVELRYPIKSEPSFPRVIQPAPIGGTPYVARDDKRAGQRDYSRLSWKFRSRTT